MHDEDEYLSKTALKKHSAALQKLGKQLVSLSEKELAGIPIDHEELLRAVRQARRIRSHSARRRHLQLIGKIMRKIDPQPIARALENLHLQGRREASALHELEQLRSALLREGNTAIGRILERFPQADRRHLRQLLRQAHREQANTKPPAASRKLFRYLRELSGQ